MKKTLTIFLTFSLLSAFNLVDAQKAAYTFPFQNPSLNEEQRVNDLISRMTLKEKADQLLYTAPAIPRLGIFIARPKCTERPKLFGCVIPCPSHIITSGF